MKLSLRVCLTLLVLQVTIVTSETVQAQNGLDSRYQYIGVHQMLTYVEDLEVEYLGQEFEASYLYDKNWFASIAHANLTRDYILNSEQKNKQSRARIGYRWHNDIANSTNFYTALGFIKSTLSSPFDATLSDTAYNASLGVANRYWAFLELYAEYNYTNWKDNNDGDYLTLGGMLLFTPNWSLSGNFVQQRDAQTFRLGVRYHY